MHFSSEVQLRSILRHVWLRMAVERLHMGDVDRVAYHRIAGHNFIATLKSDCDQCACHQNELRMGNVKVPAIAQKQAEWMERLLSDVFDQFC